MNYFRFELLSLSIFFYVFVSTKGIPKPGKDDKKGQQVRPTIFQRTTTCMGQPVDLKSGVNDTVQECFDSRIQEIQDEITNGNNDKGGKKKKGKKGKNDKKLKTRCMLECEWSAFDMLPDTNGTTNAGNSSVEIPDTFLANFPQEAQASLKTSLETCYNLPSKTTSKNGKKKKAPKRRFCFGNVKLMKCLNKAIRKTCKGKGGAVVVTPTSTAAPAASAKVGANLTTTPASASTVSASAGTVNDDEEDDAEDDDDDDDDEEDDEDDAAANATTKPSTPSTSGSVDTSKPIT